MIPSRDVLRSSSYLDNAYFCQTFIGLTSHKSRRTCKLWTRSQSSSLTAMAASPR